jgi:class 3 adenylate cyclase/pimeloyl-ACP methyl ester carboxylesterase
MNPEIRYTKNGDVHLAFQVIGTGAFDILSMPDYPFAPPLDGWWEQPFLAHAVKRLASFSRLILWDRRGAGLSDRRGEAEPLEVHMEDALAVMDAAGSERAVVVGWGPGGLLGMLFAATRPDRVSSLVLFNAFATSVWQPDYPWAETSEEREAEIDNIVQTWGTGFELSRLAPSMADDDPFKAWWGRMKRRWLSPGAVRPYWQVLGEIDARPILPAIKVPTLVLHRSRSFMPVENAHYLAERIPQSRSVELPGIDAVAWLDGWDALADEIEEFLTGRPPVDTYEDVLATVLFTDMVGSTVMAASLGDRRWREFLDAHEVVTDIEIERHRGRLVDRAGDGLFATFDGPARAVRCAASLRDRVKDIGIDVRAGVHTGEMSQRAGHVGGITVHIGARIMSLAGAGDVFVSRTVKDLVAGSGLRFVDRGIHRLKGVADEWQIFALEGSGEPPSIADSEQTNPTVDR